MQSLDLYSAQDILENYKTNIFTDVVSIYNPLTNAGTFMRKVHQSQVFNNIQESINGLSNQEREELMENILLLDPDEDTATAWEKAYNDFMGIKNKKLTKVLTHATNYLKSMEERQRVEAIRDMLKKVQSDIAGLHMNIAANITESKDVEQLLVIDETLTLLLSAIRHCMDELKKSKTDRPKEYFGMMFILLIRLEKFRRQKISLERMYWTNAAVSTALPRKETITTAPDELLSIMAR